MPHVEFFPTRVTLALHAGQGPLSSGGEKSYLIYRVQSSKPWDSEIKLATGEDFSKLQGSVCINRGPIPADWPLVPKPKFWGGTSTEKISVLGSFTYNEPIDDEFNTAAASYYAEIWLPPSQVDELMQAAHLGKMPRAIAFEVVGEGFKYGSAPDGSVKEWDNKTHRQLAIIEASTYLVLGASASDVDEEADERGIPVPDPAPTRSQIADLLKYVAGLRKALFWVCALLAAVLLFSIRW